MSPYNATLFYVYILSSKSPLELDIRCRRYLKIYCDESFIQENSIKYITGALRMFVVSIRCYIALQLCTAAQRSRWLPNILYFCTGILQAPQVLYAPRTTASSCLSARKPATNHETTQSPTAPHSTLLLPDDTSRPHRPSIKHVQFPDDAAHSSPTSEGSLPPT